MFSRILRRIHLYIALFLTPWVLIYTFSTFVMNHREWFRGRPPEPPRWIQTREFIYPGEFAPDAGREAMAGQLLATLQMDGTHQSQLRDGRLVVQRLRALRPVRVTYTLADRRVVVEEQSLEASTFLERMHRRRGFQHPYALEDAWAFSVDLFIAAMLVWMLTGFWMWWEMKTLRRAGALALAGGICLFALFLRVL